MLRPFGDVGGFLLHEATGQEWRNSSAIIVKFDFRVWTGTTLIDPMDRRERPYPKGRRKIGRNRS